MDIVWHTVYKSTSSQPIPTSRTRIIAPIDDSAHPFNLRVEGHVSTDYSGPSIGPSSFSTSYSMQVPPIDRLTHCGRASWPACQLTCSREFCRSCAFAL